MILLTEFIRGIWWQGFAWGAAAGFVVGMGLAALLIRGNKP